MKDVISQNRIQELNPVVRSIFQQFIEECEAELNITIRIMEPVFRTIKQQDDLYAIGRTVETDKPILTNAKGGGSYHNYGLAVDLCHLMDNKVDWNYDMGHLTTIAHKYGIEWGGDWMSIKDKPHFQKTFGYKWQELFALYKDGKIDENGYVIIEVENC